MHSFLSIIYFKTTAMCLLLANCFKQGNFYMQCWKHFVCLIWARIVNISKSIHAYIQFLSVASGVFLNILFCFKGQQDKWYLIIMHARTIECHWDQFTWFLTCLLWIPHKDEGDLHIQDKLFIPTILIFCSYLENKLFRT